MRHIHGIFQDKTVSFILFITSLYLMLTVYTFHSFVVFDRAQYVRNDLNHFWEGTLN